MMVGSKVSFFRCSTVTKTSHTRHYAKPIADLNEANLSTKQQLPSAHKSSTARLAEVWLKLRSELSPYRQQWFTQCVLQPGGYALLASTQREPSV
jgi:hypothetical protein